MFVPRMASVAAGYILLICHCVYVTAGSYVSAGSRVSINYLSSICDMDVVKILVENGEFVGEANGVSEIDEKLSNLNLSKTRPEVLDCSTSVDELISTTADSQLRFFRIAIETKLVLLSIDEQQKKPMQSPVMTLDDVGGVESQKALLIRLIKLMLHQRNEELSDRYGN